MEAVDDVRVTLLKGGAHEHSSSTWQPTTLTSSIATPTLLPVGEDVMPTAKQHRRSSPRIAGRELHRLVELEQSGPGTKLRKPRGRVRGFRLGSRLGCAGSQLDFPNQQIQGVADAWVPFEESIAIGW